MTILHGYTLQYKILDEDGISDDVDLTEDDVEQQQGRADESDGQAGSMFSLGKHPKLSICIGRGWGRRTYFNPC